MTIPLVSNIIAGLMSQDDKIKLDSLSNNPSGSVIETHQFSASYFSMSSGSVNTLSATTLTVYDLVVQNSTITASAVASSSVLQAHNLSASYFQFISGNVRTLTGTGIKTNWLSSSIYEGSKVYLFEYLSVQSEYNSSASIFRPGLIQLGNDNDPIGEGINIEGTRLFFPAAYTDIDGNTIKTNILSSTLLTITDLAAINTNITATIPDPLSSSVQRAHNLSASYFEFISGNVRTLTGTGIKTNALSASSVSIDRLTASYITGSEYRANTIYCNQLETVGYIIVNGPNQAYLGGGFTTDGSNATLAGGDITDVRQISSDKISSSLATFEDLVVINTNITATIPDPLSSSVQRAHNLSASYFQFISGNVRTLTGTTSVTSPRGVFTDLVVTNTNITATIPDPLSSSVQRAHNLSASYFEFISGNVRTLTGTGLQTMWLSTTSGTIAVITASYLTGTEFKARTGSFSIHNSHIMTATNFTASSGSVHVFTSSYLTGTESRFHRISSSYINSSQFSSSFYASLTHLDTNGNLTSYGNFFSLATSTLTIYTSSKGQNHQLSASYFSMSSGSINNLTSTNVIASNIGGNFCKVLTSSFSCSTSGYQYIEVFSHSIDANQSLSIQCLLMLTGSRIGPAGNYSGTIIGVFAPSGSFINGIAMPPNNSLQTRYDFITGSGEIATSVGAINSTILHFWDSRFGIINGNTAGVVYISIRRVSALHTLSVMSGSTFIVMSSKLA